MIERTGFALSSGIAFACDAIKTSAIGRIAAAGVLILVIGEQRVMIENDRRKLFDSFGIVVFARHFKNGAACRGDFDAFKSGIETVQFFSHHDADVVVCQCQKA